MKRYLIPLAVFVALAALLAVGLNLDPRKVPSPLVGKPAPAFELPRLQAPQQRVSHQELLGRPWVLNVWASWCVPCRQEHPVLMDLARDGRVEIVGLNYKDKPDNARRFLGELGNPYTALGVDPSGRAAIEWGVYGIPETFLVGKDGTIALKHVGPFDPRNVTTTLMPEIEKALAAQ